MTSAPAGSGTRPRFVRRTNTLSAERWSRFVTRCRDHRLTPTAALLTVYSDMLRTWSGTERFALVLTLFDRPDVHPDVNRVVGDFTSLILHESAPRPGGSFLARARATQDELFDDLDHREYSAIEFLAEQSAAAGVRRPVPVVFTGALGVHDTVDDSGSLEWVGTQVAAVSRTPQTWLDHQVLEQDGELRLQWDALDGIFAEDDLDRVVRAQTDAVTALADDVTAWEAPATEAVPPLRAADCLVPLRTARAENAPTVFLLHPSGGDVLCYAGLSQLLTADVSVVAVTDPLLVGDTAGATTIEGIARQYLAAIRSEYSAPVGGWLLGGWSMGGSLAQEMARQLHVAGEHVSLLVMLDSNDPTFITPIPGDTADKRDSEVARRQLGALEAFLDIDLDIGDDAWARVCAGGFDARLRAVADRLRANKLLGTRDDGRRRSEVFGRHLSALGRHVPRLLADDTVRTLLFRCTRQAPNNSGIGMGIDDTPPELFADLGWSRHLAGDVTVIDLDTHHYGVLRRPAVEAVAAALDAAVTDLGN